MIKKYKKRKILPPEELYNHPEDYYKGDVLKQYTHSKSLMRIQERITKRALDIIKAEPPSLILDLGAGCGFSTTYLYLKGFTVVNLDLIFEMLVEYDISELNPVNSDMRFLPFRENSFDYVVSISAFQWIINKMERNKRNEVLKRIAIDIRSILKPKGKCVIQFYPIEESILKEIGEIFADYGKFKGNFIIDNPKSGVKRKIFLYLENFK
ncbi:MAG: class I SAM-dependent methyltransferase [Promethearchaeota archaeon]